MNHTFIFAHSTPAFKKGTETYYCKYCHQMIRILEDAEIPEEAWGGCEVIACPFRYIQPTAEDADNGSIVDCDGEHCAVWDADRKRCGFLSASNRICRFLGGV